jgi:hypothetical protein
MARYVASLHSPRSVDDVFAYLSDFSTTQEWDPGVVEARRVEDGPVGAGSKFVIVARFLGRETTLTYEIVDLVPRVSVTLRGENSTVVSRDTITCKPDPRGTRVTYDAELTLKGPLKLADPLLALAFGRVGDRALEGLRAQLA